MYYDLNNGLVKVCNSNGSVIRMSGIRIPTVNIFRMYDYFQKFARFLKFPIALTLSLEGARLASQLPTIFCSNFAFFIVYLGCLILKTIIFK